MKNQIKYSKYCLYGNHGNACEGGHHLRSWIIESTISWLQISLTSTEAYEVVRNRELEGDDGDHNGYNRICKQECQPLRLLQDSNPRPAAPLSNVLTTLFLNVSKTYRFRQAPVGFSNFLICVKRMMLQILGCKPFDPTPCFAKSTGIISIKLFGTSNQ